MDTKTIILKVEIEVPEDYNVNEPEWTLNEAVDLYNHKVNITSVTKF